MSSSHKKNLTVGATTTKGAGAAIIGDTIVLPPDSEELLLAITADDSISGDVKATLEVSADGVNWTEAQTSTGAAGGGIPARISIDNVDNQISNNIVNTPVLDAAQYTDVCRVSFAGSLEAIDAEYSLTLSGDDAANYRLNNVTSGDVSAPVTAQFEDDVVLETASTFAFTTTGYNHDVTITVVEDGASSTDTVNLNCTRTVPATLSNGSVAVLEGDSADGTDVSTLTPGGGPTGCTYSLAITGTDAAYYRIHNTTAGTKSDDSAPLKTLSGIASGNSIVLETDELFNFSEATTHSITITNTESSTGNTASVNLTITVNAVVSFSNNKYLYFDTVETDQFLTTGTQSDYDDSDSFWFRRRTDKWTISFWYKSTSTATSTIFASGYGSGSTPGILWYNGGSGSLSEFYFWSTNGKHGRFRWSHIGSLFDGNWHHIAITWDGPGAVTAGQANANDYLKIYDNGSAITTAYTAVGTWLDADDETSNTTTHFAFGDNGSIANQVMSVDDIAIWKTDLSASQISTIYNSGTPNSVATIEASNLKRYYLFEDSDGTDDAGNFTATIGSAANVEDH
ncbi:MAG: putative concanavalin A-like lectin/glucanases superfamily protein [Prokaryotic dsDNA virus sp.]|nr:MAG: putative concanavalin A-like lectin/glucanases superfamily protein [Prokaryotic dsDNA virus sp.]|tara:strand:+ start:1510 stop:3216 length:1707 start_codon:yes stop_codon:yes gene_type:complete